NVKREFGQTTAEDFIEPSNAGWQLADEDLARIWSGVGCAFARGGVRASFHVYFPGGESLVAACGQTSCTRRSVKASPTKVTRRPSNSSVSTPPACAASGVSSRASISGEYSNDPFVLTCTSPSNGAF